MRELVIIAIKEFRDGIRNRWFLGATAALVLFSLSLTFLGSAPAGTVGVDQLAVTIVSLASLSVFLLPLMALLLSYDALVGEVERGTMLLLLTYPLSRSDIIIGKFLGQTLGLGLATILGFGSAALVLVYRGIESANWMAFGVLIGSSVVLGAAFVALGLAISAMPRQRSAAAALAFGVWLCLVIVYDMALLGALVADGGEGISAPVFDMLLTVNPADAFRMINLSGFEDVRVAAGLVISDLEGIGNGFAPVLSLGMWVVVPLILAVVLFRRKQL
jgi:Cu-processing system permease protein